MMLPWVIHNFERARPLWPVYEPVIETNMCKVLFFKGSPCFMRSFYLRLLTLILGLFLRTRNIQAFFEFISLTREPCIIFINLHVNL